MYQLTEEERKELKQLKSRGLIYIARDSDGGLWAYNYPPERKDITWDLYLDDKKIVLIDPELLKFITWEDEEPYEIEKLLEGKNGKL